MRSLLACSRWSIMHSIIGENICCFDDLPTPQFVYNSARNLETAAYSLRTQRNASGQPYLYADGIQDEILNASYSQLMGEMIGLQDALATALAKKDQRTLNAVARGAASFVFLPVGF